MIPYILQARPGRNGNSRDDFLKAHYALQHAVDAAKGALTEVRTSVIHGRNYQHIPTREGGVAERERDLDKIIDAIRAIQTLEGLRDALRASVIDHDTRQGA